MVDQKLKVKALHRVKIIKGQIEGLIKSIENEEYCTQLLRLSLSIQRSLKSLDAVLLENHLKTHVKHQMTHKDESEQAVKELIEVFELSQKS